MPERCLAPVFRGQSIIGCVFLNLILGAVLLIALFAALFSESGRCWVKGILFRMRHCRDGNKDPNIAL